MNNLLEKLVFNLYENNIVDKNNIIELHESIKVIEEFNNLIESNVPRVNDKEEEVPSYVKLVLSEKFNIPKDKISNNIKIKDLKRWRFLKPISYKLDITEVLMAIDENFDINLEESFRNHSYVGNMTVGELIQLVKKKVRERDRKQ